jgi:hypothetical protein
MEMGRVVRRFDQFRPKLFRDVANDAMHDHKEADPFFDVDLE